METDLSIISLVMRASFLVQLVMISLLLASVLSWAVIYLKYHVVKHAKNEAIRFEDNFGRV